MHTHAGVQHMYSASLSLSLSLGKLWLNCKPVVGQKRTCGRSWDNTN